MDPNDMATSDINPPDMNDIYEMIVNSNKRKLNILEFSSTEIINDLKIIAIDKLLNNIPNYKGKQLSTYLQNLKSNIETLINSMVSNKKLEGILQNKVVMNALIAQLYVCVEIIIAALFEYSKDKKLNFKNYLMKIKKELNVVETKKVKSDEIEEDSEYETSDDEEEAFLLSFFSSYAFFELS